MNDRPLLSERLFTVILLATAAVVALDLLCLAGKPPAAPLEWRLVAAPNVCALAENILYEPNPATGSAAWVAELVTRESLAGDAKRANSFRADPNVPPGLRARDADYRASGYDRGHLAAAGNHGGQAERDATFSLVNVVPQHPAVNRGPLRLLEESLRGVVEADPAGGTSLVIVTAPLYELDAAKRTAGRLPVPSSFVKAVLVLEEGAPVRGGAWRIKNVAGAGIELLSIDDVEQLLQRDLFAWLADEIEAPLESGTASWPP